MAAPDLLERIDRALAELQAIRAELVMADDHAAVDAVEGCSRRGAERHQEHGAKPNQPAHDTIFGAQRLDKAFEHPAIVNELSKGDAHDGARFVGVMAAPL